MVLGNTLAIEDILRAVISRTGGQHASEKPLSGEECYVLQSVGYSENDKGSWLLSGYGKGNEHTAFTEEPSVYFSLSPSTWIEDHKSP